MQSLCYNNFHQGHQCSDEGMAMYGLPSTPTLPGRENTTCSIQEHALFLQSADTNQTERNFKYISALQFQLIKSMLIK